MRSAVPSPSAAWRGATRSSGSARSGAGGGSAVVAVARRGASGADPADRLAAFGGVLPTQPVPAAGPTTVELLRAYHAEEARALAQFAGTIAAHFDCRSLLDPRHLIRIKESFISLRRLAHQLRGEDERRARG